MPLFLTIADIGEVEPAIQKLGPCEFSLNSVGQLKDGYLSFNCFSTASRGMSFSTPPLKSNFLALSMKNACAAASFIAPWPVSRHTAPLHNKRAGSVKAP